MKTKWSVFVMHYWAHGVNVGDSVALASSMEFDLCVCGKGGGWLNQRVSKIWR